MIKFAIIGEQCAGKTSIAKLFMGFYPNYAVVKFADPIYGSLNALAMPKHRRFMQEFGDLAKKHFGELVFVDSFKKRALEIMVSSTHEGMPVDCIINDDTRRKYELEAARELGFFILYVDTPEEVRKARADDLGLEFVTNHNSETEVKSMKENADFVLDGTLSKTELQDFIGSTVIPTARSFNR